MNAAARTLPTNLGMVVFVIMLGCMSVGCDSTLSKPTPSEPVTGAQPPSATTKPNEPERPAPEQAVETSAQPPTATTKPNEPERPVPEQVVEIGASPPSVTITSDAPAQPISEQVVLTCPPFSLTPFIPTAPACHISNQAARINPPPFATNIPNVLVRPNQAIGTTGAVLPKVPITPAAPVRNVTDCRLSHLLLGVVYDNPQIDLYYQKDRLNLAAEAYRIRYSAEFIVAFDLCMANRLDDIAGDSESASTVREEIQAKLLFNAALKDARGKYLQSLLDGFFLERLETKIRKAKRHLTGGGCDPKARVFAAENIRTSWRNTATIDNSLTKAAYEYVACLEHTKQ